MSLHPAGKYANHPIRSELLLAQTEDTMAYPEKGATYEHNPRFLQELQTDTDAGKIGKLAREIRTAMKSEPNTQSEPSEEA